MLVKYRFMKMRAIPYTRAMRFLPILISLIASISFAHAVECEDAMMKANAEVENDNIFFNRWNLPDGTKAEPLMGAMVNQIAGVEKRPMIILDTNPGQGWSAFNIIPPEADQLFPGLTYRQLTRVQKDILFAEFTVKALERLRSDEMPVLIFDHHFNSTILSEASATPLIIDYLLWAEKHLPKAERELMQATIAEGVHLRDHSDPDILLANTAAMMAKWHRNLSAYSGLMKDIAYYNDHSYLDPNYTPKARSRVILGYYVLMGFERAIADGKISFERAMTAVDAALERVVHVNSKVKLESEDGLPEMIHELETFYLKHYLAPVVEAMRVQKAERDLFQEQMRAIYTTPAL